MNSSNAEAACKKESNSIPFIVHSRKHVKELQGLSGKRPEKCRRHSSSKHFPLAGNGVTSWAGLTLDGGEKCVADECNGKMTWADGTKFTHDEQLYVQVEGESGKCYTIWWEEMGNYINLEMQHCKDENRVVCMLGPVDDWKMEGSPKELPEDTTKGPATEPSKGIQVKYLYA